MALSQALAQAGTPRSGSRRSATVDLPARRGHHRGRLTVRGTVAGMSEDDFRAAAETAKANCPVSKALAGVPEVELEASLA